MEIHGTLTELNTYAGATTFLLHGKDGTFTRVQVSGPVPPGLKNGDEVIVNGENPRDPPFLAQSVVLVPAKPKPSRKILWAAIAATAVALIALIIFLRSATKTPSAPASSDLCKVGFVWREGNPGDHVCVTPATRSATARDNQLALSRRNPNGGPYGPDTCLQGYVWRDAFSNDHVCVIPTTRDEAKADNAQAAARRAQ
jgi:hypothetical protein